MLPDVQHSTRTVQVPSVAEDHIWKVPIPINIQYDAKYPKSNAIYDINDSPHALFHGQYLSLSQGMLDLLLDRDDHLLPRFSFHCLDLGTASFSCSIQDTLDDLLDLVHSGRALCLLPLHDHLYLPTFVQKVGQLLQTVR